MCSRTVALHLRRRAAADRPASRNPGIMGRALGVRALRPPSERCASRVACAPGPGERAWWAVARRPLRGRAIRLGGGAVQHASLQAPAPWVRLPLGLWRCALARHGSMIQMRSTPIEGRTGSLAHRLATVASSSGRVSLLPGSQRLDGHPERAVRDAVIQQRLHADAVAVQVRRPHDQRLMKHFGMDFDLVIMDCPAGAVVRRAGGACTSADHIGRMPYPSADFVSQFSSGTGVAMLIERVAPGEQLASIDRQGRRRRIGASAEPGARGRRAPASQGPLAGPPLARDMPEVPAPGRTLAPWSRCEPEIRACRRRSLRRGDVDS